MLTTLRNLGPGGGRFFSDKISRLLLGDCCLDLSLTISDVRTIHRRNSGMPSILGLSPKGSTAVNYLLRPLDFRLAFLAQTAIVFRTRFSGGPPPAKPNYGPNKARRGCAKKAGGRNCERDRSQLDWPEKRVAACSARAGNGWLRVSSVRLAHGRTGPHAPKVFHPNQ